mmetsp:Transcript_10412/g.22600  ORF Transcript_10412/g.22600 Transcript_10412/m.22600 type:complete len:91 (+) Transcript_10412:189-461(+)
MDPMVWELFVVAEPADEKLREADGGLTPIKKGFCGSDMPHILLGDFCLPLTPTGVTASKRTIFSKTPKPDWAVQRFIRRSCCPRPPSSRK